MGIGPCFFLWSFRPADIRPIGRIRLRLTLQILPLRKVWERDRHPARGDRLLAEQGHRHVGGGIVHVDRRLDSKYQNRILRRCEYTG